MYTPDFQLPLRIISGFCGPSGIHVPWPQRAHASYRDEDECRMNFPLPKDCGESVCTGVGAVRKKESHMLDEEILCLRRGSWPSDRRQVRLKKFVLVYGHNPKKRQRFI